MRIIYRLYSDEDKTFIRYPEDIPIIREYLIKHGRLEPVSDIELSDLYGNFCSDYDASWLDPSGFWLETFSKWLNKKIV